MKNKKNRKFKFVINLLVTISLFFSQTTIALGDMMDVGTLMGVGSPAAFLDDILSDLGFEKENLEQISQTANVMSQKKTPPQVSLFFSPTAPDEGEKITATASPSYFLNEPKDLYYTWFLKSKDCEQCKKGDCKPAVLASCDLDGNDRVNIEDYKIKATRIIVNGGFSATNPDDPNDTEYIDDIYADETDDDGYEAVSGGDDQRGKPAYCYVHDVKSGKEYEMDSCGNRDEGTRHLFPNFNPALKGGVTGDGKFNVEEERFWHTDPNSNDTAHRGNVDEANVAGLGILDFTWNYQKGDEVGVAVEGISTESTQTKDASYKIMWAMSNGVYTLDANNNDDYPKTDTNTTTTIDAPIAGQTTTINVTTREEIDVNDKGKQKIEDGKATIKTTVTTETIITDSATQEVQSIVSVVSDPTYSKVNGFGLDIEGEKIEKPSDLSFLLYDALVAPSENSAGSNKLDINLSYSPTNPINDPRNENGDTLVIQSSIPNAKDRNYLQYSWKVYASNEINPLQWGDPNSSPLILKNRLKDSTQTTGLGLDTLKFKLALKDDDDNSDKFSYKYLRILLTVKENTGENFSRVNSQDIIIPITSINIDDQINAFNANIVSANVSDLNPSGVFLELGNEICNDPDKPMEQAICPVTKNQIIGLSIPENHFPKNSTDFLWTIDGKTTYYSYCFFDGCNVDNLEKQINNIYFPITKEVGEQYIINLTATSASGKKINLTRNFKVVDPEIEIVSVDKLNCDRLVLGNYIDVNEQTFPDESKLNFWAKNSAKIKLNVETNGFSVSPTNYVWNIDGENINYTNASKYGFTFDSDGTLILPLKETKGESYSLTVNTLYTQDNLTKKALKNIWDVSYNQFYEKILSDDAIITMLDDSDAVGSQGPTKKIFASIYSSTPAYIAFLLRIVLTISLMLFTAKLVFSFSPENKKEEY